MCDLGLARCNSGNARFHSAVESLIMRALKCDVDSGENTAERCVRIHSGEWIPSIVRYFNDKVFRFDTAMPAKCTHACIRDVCVDVQASALGEYGDVTIRIWNVHDDDPCAYVNKSLNMSKKYDLNKCTSRDVLFEYLLMMAHLSVDIQGHEDMSDDGPWTNEEYVRVKALVNARLREEMEDRVRMVEREYAVALESAKEIVQI